MHLKKLIRICPVCECEQAEVLHHQVFAIYDETPLPSGYDIVACICCGFTFADTPASQSQYDSYYLKFSKYEDDRVSSGFGQNPWDIDRLQQTASDIANFIPDYNASLLDVGAAGGGLLNEMERRGYWNLSGLDHAPSCIQKIAADGYNAYLGGITSLPKEFTGKHFDGIFLSHVLEHIRDLRGALSECSTLLSDNGILYIETPDARRYPDFSTVPYYFFDCEHINHFSSVSLRTLAEQFGLRFIAGDQKTYMASSTTPYPAVWAVFKRESNFYPTAPIYDSSAKNGVVQHINLSKCNLFMPDIEILADKRIPVIVWGAGSFAQRLLQNSSLSRCNILYFVDNDRNKQGKRLNSLDIRSPDEIDQVTAPIIICSALFNHDILNQIKLMKIKNPTCQIFNKLSGFR